MNLLDHLNNLVFAEAGILQTRAVCACIFDYLHTRLLFLLCCTVNLNWLANAFLGFASLKSKTNLKRKRRERFVQGFKGTLLDVTGILPASTLYSASDVDFCHSS